VSQKAAWAAKEKETLEAKLSDANGKISVRS
jgi:hypothetical protein